MFQQACRQIRDALSQIPILTHIENEADYEQALELLDELMDNYDANSVIIDLLGTSIAKWENESQFFAEFNRQIAALEPGVAVLRIIMDQQSLAPKDFPELGSKANVSKILNATDGKKLTRRQIEALSTRFNISPAVFF